MDIMFFANNRKERLHLPIVPEGLEWDNPHKNETFDTIQHGEINLIGLKGLTTLSIDSFFPMKSYSFVKSKVLGTACVAFFNKWKNLRQPIRIIVINKAGLELLNILVSIESFTYGLDQVGDIPYKLDLKEYIDVKVI
jgi:hypothetical protein